MIDIDTLPGSEVNRPVYRVILSRYPQINLFERVSGPQDWDVLYAVESLTNPTPGATLMDRPAPELTCSELELVISLPGSTVQSTPGSNKR